MIGKVCFSVNEFDVDGDVSEAGIYLHFDDTRILVAHTLEEFKNLSSSIESMAEEISGQINQ